MSLFDMIKEKATELLGGAGDKVSELTGVDLPVDEAVETATAQGQEVLDSTGTIGDTAAGLAGDVIDPTARG